MWYVYILLRPDKRPFYVGKGTGNRVHQHEKEAATDCQCHKCRVIRKIWRNGGQVVKSIVFNTTREEEAYQVEADYIERLGLGNLTNLQRGTRPWTGKRYRRSNPGNIQEWVNFWKRNGVSPKRIRELKRKHLTLELQEALRQWRYRHLGRFSKEQIAALASLIDGLQAALGPEYIEQERFTF